MSFVRIQYDFKRQWGSLNAAFLHKTCFIISSRNLSQNTSFTIYSAGFLFPLKTVIMGTIKLTFGKLADTINTHEELLDLKNL